MLLGVLTQDSDDNKKKEQLNSHRAQYKQLADKYLSAASTKQKPVFNPLVKITSGLDIFDDNELKLDIKKDVDRTYQDRPIFQHPKIKKILTNILFIWAKQNSSFSYR